MKRIEIHQVPATDASFAPYGQCISSALRKPDSSGEELAFWNKLAVMDHEGHTSVSIVRTYGRNRLEEHTLERHERTSEVLIPTEDIIVVAALSNAADPKMPDLDTVKAFSVPKGSAVRFKKGVWHHAPLTQAEVANTFVLFYENTPDEDFLAYELDAQFGCYFVVR